MTTVTNKRSFASPAVVRTVRFLPTLLFLATITAPAGVAGVLPAPAAAQAENDVERAETSRLAAIRLPRGAYRSTNKGDLVKFEDALQKIAQTSGGKMTRSEVLIWRGNDARPAMEALPTRLKDAGYQYAPGDAFDAEPGHVTPFAAVVKDKSSSVVGLWIETRNGDDSYTLLVWGAFQSGKADTPDVGNANNVATDDEPKAAIEPPVNAIKPVAVPAKPVKVAGGSGKVPADLLGKTWSWTTISGVGYRDTVTNQLAEPSGMSARFKFTPDGRYDFFFYVRQRTYSLVTQSTTTHQGQVTFNGDGSFTMRPAKGHYKGSTGAKLLDRPMTEAERKPVTYWYEWRTENGKRQLYIGPSKSSLSHFKPAE